MLQLQDFIDGARTIAKSANFDCTKHFRDKGYKQIIPHASEEPPRQLITDFYQKDNMFSLKPETLKELRTVYKTDGGFNILFAASFFIIEIERYIIIYLEVIKTAGKFRRQGFGTTFIDHVKEYTAQLLRSKNYNSAFFFVGQSQILKPHKFFDKLNFGVLSDQFKHLKVEGCDMAMLEIMGPDVD